MYQDIVQLQRQTKRLLAFFIFGLIISGLTALPIEWQLSSAQHVFDYFSINNGMRLWLDRVYIGVTETNKDFPFIAYGTDWLAFAHFVIAIAFIGPWRDPIKNIWVIEFGLIACLCIFPFAAIAGSLRGIPLFWRLIDCSFGVVGGIILYRCQRNVKSMESIINMLISS